MADNNNGGGSIGLVTCVTMLAGGMIGSAIFSLSGLTIYKAGPAALITWVIAAVIMLGYGLVVAELSTIFPKSGGVFVFPRRTFAKNEKKSKLLGWISVWGYINANVIAIAFAAIYVGTYLGAGFPIFANKQVPLAIVSVLIILVLNSVSFSLAGKANTVMVVGLAVTMVIYAVVGITHGQWDAGTMVPFFTQGTGGSAGFLAVVPTAMVAYGSIVAMAFMVSEVKDPNKTVPKSILIAMGLVVILFLLVLLATVGLVSAQFLEENPGMRYIPLYAAAFTKLADIAWLPKLISISATLALFTTMLVVMALTSRAMQAAAEDGILPSKLAENNKAGVPVYAAIVITIISAVISCFPQFTEIIVSLAALFAVVTISINCISLIVARKTHVRKPGEFRAPGGNALPIIALILICICYIPDIIGGGWMIWAFTIAWYIVGLIIFKARVK